MGIRQCGHDFVWADQSMSGRWRRIFFVGATLVNPEKLESALREAFHKLPTADDALILGDPRTIRALRDQLSKVSNFNLVKRFPRTKIRLLEVEPTLEATELLVNGNQPSKRLRVPRNQWVDSIQTAIWRECSPIERAPEGTYFAKSKGRKNLYFIRASRLLQFEAQQFFIALMCLSDLSQRSPQSRLACIHVDTNSISCVGHAIGELVSAYSTSLSSSRPSVRTFQSYSGLPSLHVNVDEDVAIVSASSSGALSRDLVKQTRLPRRRVVTLVGDSSRNASDLIVFDVAKDADYKLARDLEQTQDLSLRQPIRIDDSEFIFDADAGRAVLLNVLEHASAKWSESDSGRQKINVGDQVEALSAGVLVFLKASPDNSKVIRRPFGVDIEKSLMSKTEHGFAKFLHRVLTSELKFHARNLVLVAEANPSDRAHLMTFLQADFEGKNCHICAELGDAERSYNPTHVIVVAPVIASGYIVEDQARAIREMAPDASRVFCIGLWAANTKDRAGALRRTIGYSGTHTPFAIHTMARVAVGNTLAGLSGEHAWTSEKRHLESLLPDARELFASRIAELKRPNCNSVVWRYNQTAPQCIAATFAFWSERMSAKGNKFTQTDVLLTIAGVLENARELSITHPDSLRQLAYQHRVISAENFFRFNEPLVQGCILRCASSLELDYSNLSGESDAVAAYLVSMIHAPNSSRAEALYEFLLALATKRLRLDKKDFEQVVASAESIDWCSALLNVQSVLT